MEKAISWWRSNQACGGGRSKQRPVVAHASTKISLSLIIIDTHKLPQGHDGSQHMSEHGSELL